MWILWNKTRIEWYPQIFINFFYIIYKKFHYTDLVHLPWYKRMQTFGYYNSLLCLTIHIRLQYRIFSCKISFCYPSFVEVYINLQSIKTLAVVPHVLHVSSRSHINFGHWLVRILMWPHPIPIVSLSGKIRKPAKMSYKFQRLRYHLRQNMHYKLVYIIFSY